VRVPNGATIMSSDVRHLVWAELPALDLAEFEGNFFACDLVWNESSLGVNEHSEALTGSGDSDDVLKASGVFVISANLVVHTDETFLVSADLDALLGGQGVLQLVLQKNSEGHTLSEFVWALRGAHGVNTLKFLEHPVVWRVHTL